MGQVFLILLDSCLFLMCVCFCCWKS